MSGGHFSDDRRSLLLSQLALATRSEKLQTSTRNRELLASRRSATATTRFFPSLAPIKKLSLTESFFVAKSYLNIFQLHNSAGLFCVGLARYRSLRSLVLYVRCGYFVAFTH
jgi:hypothetical protein